MSIQREEITIKEFTTGTTLVFFSTHLTANTEILERDSTIEYTPSIVTLNNFSIPTDISTFDGQNLWKLNSDNIYEPISATSNNFLTGYSYSKKINQILETSTIQNIENEFTQSITDSIGTAVTTSHTEYLFADYNEIDDFYVNIKLNKSFATLDTLNIYNNLVNSIPTQEADTGVVFGRLMALQTIRDPEGNRIKIPLRNVPVGLFNSSDDYPTPAAFSDDGDRIFLNIKESSEQSDYFNVESFNLDKNVLLRSASQFTTVPEQYKYVTTTNDEGEFVIYNAPIGSQIVMFEVDLMKQGLTRDEIALNFFPFPADEDAVIDQIPNFSFKQFPIEVVPAWGTIQTGYTELNVVVNMDLRKWTTYFIPPVSVGGAKLEAAVANSAANSLKIGVRNMAKQSYPNSSIKMTVIPNDLDRVNNQQLNWNLEFAQVRNEAEFFKFGISILKLPANIYDPNGYRTDKDGVPVIHPSQKGVWLSAYQLNIFNDANSEVWRKSGAQYEGGGKAHSHYDLNYTDANVVSQNFAKGSGINSFPYEKPWSVEYPNKYSIPEKPTQERFIQDKTTGRAETSSANIYYLDEPSFSDGDMVGNLVDSDRDDTAGGFGMQPVDDGSLWIPNRVAQSITKNYMYKYESDVAINEQYTNGYQPSNPNYIRFVGVSKVKGGENYQRLECGYGYFCRPEGWPRVARYVWGGGGEALFKPDVTHGLGLRGSLTTPGPGTTGSIVSDNLWASNAHRNDIYNIQTQNPALALDRNNGLKHAGIDFYRVIDSSKDNLTPFKPFVIPTFTFLHTSDGPAERINPFGFFSLKNTGEITVRIPYWLNTGSGTFSVWTPSQGFHTGTSTLKPGETLFIRGFPLGNVIRAMEYTRVKLPGNSNFNTSTNRYDISSYSITIAYSPPFWNNGPSIRTHSINMSANANPPTYWIKTYHRGGNGGLSSIGFNTLTCSLSNSCNPNYEIAGMAIENNNIVTQS